MLSNQPTGGQLRSIDIERSGRMVLDPLTEVRIRVLMAVCISRRQLMVDVLRHGKWCKPQDDADQAQRHSRSQEGKN